MTPVFRNLEHPIKNALERNRSILLLGPRQTGKTTLLTKMGADLSFSFDDPETRLSFEKNPSQFRSIVELWAQRHKKKPLIILDEIQKIPELLDAVQYLIDRKLGQFILCGSSARKLREQKVNWLPGRVVVFHMSPLMLSEQRELNRTLESMLLYGSLPSVSITPEPEHQEQDLRSYVTTYLEEEIRSEALVRQVGLFARFLELSASESGSVLNFNKLSQEIGVAQSTISHYYQILEDCLIIERIEPLTDSKTRRKLTRTPKYLFFDLGVRRVAAEEGLKPSDTHLGHLFEQFVGLELKREQHYSPDLFKISFWRDPDGPEVDWVVQTPEYLFPIEVKLTDKPSSRDAKHLEKFMSEYPKAKKGFVVCQTQFEFEISPNIIALPWKQLSFQTLKNFLN